MRRATLLLALVLALAACSGGESSPQPAAAKPAGQGTPVAKPGMKIVTELEKPPTPTPAPASPTALPPTSTPLPVARLELVSSRTYRDSAGSLWIVGEAKNTGDTTATNVEVTFSLLGADGKRVAVTYATTHLAQVPPQGRTPFRGMFAQPPATWKDLRIDLTAAPPDPNDRPEFVDGLKLERANLSAATGGGGAVIAGEVKNDGKDPALTVRVVAVLRGQDGKVVDVVDGYTKVPELAPGATSPFSLQFFDGKQVGPYEVFLQGRAKPK